MNHTRRWRSAGWRWMKFNIVGWIGIGVQLGVLTALKSGLHLNYLWATALAVEAAVIHNYFWHQRFTWADRPSGFGDRDASRDSISRRERFQSSEIWF